VTKMHKKYDFQILILHEILLVAPIKVYYIEIFMF